MWIAGIFLIGASILKIHQLVTEPIISNGLWESWEFFLIQIPLELGLGIWLVCGLFRKAGWLLGLIVFGGFIGVTLYKSLSGAESCGCFGVVKVNPWITLTVVDIPIFLLLAIFRPKDLKLFPPSWPKAAHFFAIAIPTFILLPAIEYVLITNKPPMKAEKYEVIDIKQWGNQQRWSLLDYIDMKEQLQNGVWAVLMYHYDCPTCAKAVPIYEEMDKSLKGNDNAINFAFIEIPPYGNEKQQLIKPDSTVTRGRLSDVKKWYVQTPVVVVLRDGKVIKAWQGYAPNLDELLNAAFGQ
jgi:thiol-disulfide isomerase/thioredoxin